MKDYVILVCLLWLLGITTCMLIRVQDHEMKIKTLQAYNEEVWKTFNQMRTQTEND